MLAIVTALLSALAVAVGFVLQQRVAAEEPPEEQLSARLIARLVRRPLWLAGIAAMVAGQLLGAVALSRGSIVLIEPLMATNLIFALSLSSLLHRRSLGLREWGGAVALVGGLAAFVGAGNPTGGSPTHADWTSWSIAAAVIALGAGACVWIGLRLLDTRRATLFASAAGILYGLQDALTQRMTAALRHGMLALLESWSTYALVAAAVVALLLGQSAFEAAALPASLPAITIAEPISGIAIGVGVYGVHVDALAPLIAVELLGFAAMIVGVYLVAASPIVAGTARVPARAFDDPTLTRD